MAKMIPEKLSSETLNDPRRGGEVKVYRYLERRLSNDWTVFYNVSWLGKVFASGDNRDGETDFIITHAKYGIAIVEVKGGEIIEYNGVENQWYSTNKKGIRHSIKDPYIQSKNNKYSLRTEIMKWKGWKKGLGNINMCHIVIFPDVSLTKGVLPLYAKKEITVFEEDFIDIAKKIISAFKFSCNENLTDIQDTQKLINDITNTIAPSLNMQRKKVHAIEEDEQKIITLTESQYALLRTMQSIKRASISGCAGSGKTLLALKKAEMSFQAGCKVLFICFNSLLGKHLKTSLNEYPSISAGSFYSVMHQILCEMGILNYSEINNLLKNDRLIVEYFLETTPPVFDLIIVDETQDFSEQQLDIISLFINENTSVYCFWDNNQRLLRADFKIPFDMPHFTLDTSLRNTKKIFDGVKKYYYQNRDIYCDGPDGLEIRLCKPYNSFRSGELKQKVTHEILGLLNTEKIPQSDIAVLTFKSKEQSSLLDLSIPGVNISAFSNELPNDGIIVDSVRRYKGLEAKVIILTEMDDLSALDDDELWDNLNYVAFSRARTYLIILAPQNCYEKYIHLQ